MTMHHHQSPGDVQTALAAVQQALAGDEVFAQRYQTIIEGHVHWDGQGWKGIEAAARGIGFYELAAGRRVHETSGVDLSAVEWTSVVSVGCRDQNLQAGRDECAGLTHRVAHYGKPVTGGMSENDCFVWLLKHQGQSVDYAINHGGYSIQVI